MGIGLEGRVLCSLGLGNIASEMFRLAAPSGMRFIAHDPYADRERARAAGVALVELDALFADSGVLALNAPLTPATRRIVSAGRIARMKRSACLINTARGGLVDQAALAAALRERRIAGAGLDVFKAEPPSPDDPIFAAPNLIAAPHGLAWTDQGFAAIGAGCILAVEAVRAGRAPAQLADPKVLERPPRFSQ